MAKSKMSTPLKVGRPRTTKAEKEQKGSVNTTREKARAKADMKVIKLNEYPPAPADLGSEGKSHWDVVVRELTDLRALSKMDLFNLRALCIEWELYIMHRKKQMEEGIGSYFEVEGKNGKQILPHPVHYNGTNHLREYMKICNEFGLSPASRARIGLASAEPNKSKAAELLKRAV